ncbi:MAG: diacylglycerol kinase [Actinomycetota bacterium]|nr:diacylglycerol kinase [Actinomycetota bacterium]
MTSRSLLWSFNYAIAGIVYALRTQRNMRLHTLAAATVLVGALVLNVARWELVALLFAIGFVLVTELANTALEATVDLSIDRFDPMAKVAKDVAAGAVLIASINAVAVGYVVFYDRLALVAEDGLTLARQSSAGLTVIALVLTSLAVVVVKAATREGSFLRGGWPSGHTALAVGAATAIAFTTNSAKTAVLALFIAGLVAQSRVESETHTIPQVMFGALLGFLITTAVFQIFFA